MSALSSASQDNPYAAPTVSTAGQPDGVEVGLDVDQLLQRTQVTIWLKIAIAAVAIAGAVLALTGLQLWGAARLVGGFKAVPWVMFLLGAFQVVLSVKIYRQRVWATALAVATSSAATLGTGVWFVISILSGFISLLALMAPFAQGAAAVLAALAIPSCRRAASARKSLAAGGLDVDF